MIKYLKYEWKKHLWVLLIITAICTLPYVLETATMVLQFETYTGDIHIYTPNTASVSVPMAILTFIVPILIYSFKMNKRGVDGYYSLPIKREKLYLAKTVIGLALIFIPFTVAYWLGFLTLLGRQGNPYEMAWYVPAYFGYLGLGVLLFGFNAFIFTRANKIGDGVVFMLSYALIASLILSYVEKLFDLQISWRIQEGFYSWGGLSAFDTMMSDLIQGESIANEVSFGTYIYNIITGVLGYVLLFFSVSFEKAENAEQVSDSWFGYRTLIPIYMAFLFAGGEQSTLSYCIILVMGLIATIVYQRKFKFSQWCWIMLGIGLVSGVLLGGFL